MENSGSGYIGPSDLGTLALAGGRLGGGYYNRGQFAGHSSNAARILANERMIDRNAADGQFREMRHQIGHLGDQLTECCCEARVQNAELLGKIDCIQGQVAGFGAIVHNEVQLCIDSQTINTLRDQLAEARANQGNHGGGGH